MCFSTPSSFELDTAAESAAGLPPLPFSYNNTLLAGSSSFQLDECEMYTLE